MENTVYISIWLDNRRPKKNGKYPIKLRVRNSDSTIDRTYSTKFDFTESDFDKTVNSQSSKFKTERLQLQALEKRANDIIEKLPVFDITDFERLMFNKTTNKELNVNFYFQKIIDEKNTNGRLSTAGTYKNALDCIMRHHNHKSKVSKEISFKDITVSYLEDFEKYCTDIENYTVATIGIYLRNLRTVFNYAIDQKTISKDIYPFSKRKYKIKQAGKVKKALTKQQLKTLFEGTPNTPEQAKAKSFWFLSYLCNGMNIHDIIHLRFKNIEGDKLTFIRAKTENSAKAHEPIVVFIDDYSKQVFKEYGKSTGKANEFVFDVISSKDSIEDQRRKKKNFVRFINQHFRIYANNLGIDQPVSTYWARHSFSTMLLRQNEPIAVISEALGHTDLKTTMNYLEGFEDNVKKDLSKKLLNF